MKELSWADRGDAPRVPAPAPPASPPAAAAKPAKPRVVDRGSYGKLRGVRERALAVEFRLRPGRGEWPAPENAFLVATWWDPDAGGIRLEYTTGLKVRIRGRGLRELSGLLRRHRVEWVEEQGDDPVADRADPHGARVYWIEVEPPEGNGDEA